MRPAIVVGVLVGLAALVCFALGLDDVVIGLIAAGGLGGAAARLRRKADRELADVTGDRDRHVAAMRSAMGAADQLAAKQAELDGQAADLHRDADDAIKRARELDAE